MDLNISFDELKNQLMFDNMIMLEYSLLIPRLEGNVPSKTIRTFNYYYDKSTSRSLRYIRNYLYPQAVKQYKNASAAGYPFFNFVYMEQPEVTLLCKNTASLYTDTYEYTGGAHGITVRKSQSWDLQTGRIIPLSQLFRRGYDYRQAILTEIYLQAKEISENDGIYYFDNLEENIYNFFVPSDFYLTENSLAVYYQLYTIAAYAAGIQVFEIDYSYFGDNMIYKVC